MSLQTRPIPPIPELTAQIARAAFRKGNTYMQMRDLLGAFFTNDQFTDRQAAGAARSLIDWKHDFDLELGAAQAISDDTPTCPQSGGEGGDQNVCAVIIRESTG